MKPIIYICTLFMWGCTSNFLASRGSQDSSSVEELRTEIADLRHTLHGLDVDIKLLEERFENKDNTVKVAMLEKSVEKMNSDLRSLMAYASQTTASLSQYRDHISEINQRLDEVSKLRSTIAQMSKAAREIYRVKPGDSLEKIARQFNVSLEALKRVNHLSSDKIIIGQELKIPE